MYYNWGHPVPCMIIHSILYFTDAKSAFINYSKLYHMCVCVLYCIVCERTEL